MNADLTGWTCDHGSVSGPDACEHCASRCDARAKCGPHIPTETAPQIIVIDNHTGVSPLVHAFVNWLVA
jgi:hypothetical protein